MRQQVFPARGSRGISPGIEEGWRVRPSRLITWRQDCAKHRTIDPGYERMSATRADRNTVPFSCGGLT